MNIQFNKQQLEAINHYKGACAVIAGAGSGKSTVLLNRIDNLINTYSVNENNILAITFTKNTADELKSKLNKMGYNNVNVGTFHGTCGKILTQEGYSINLIKEWEIEKCFKKINDKVDVEEVKSFIGYQKSYLKSYKDEFIYKSSDYTEDELRKYFKTYELMKSQSGTWDFDDYLIKCYELLKCNKGKYTYDFILVDEHQDSNLVQNLLIKELCPSGNVFCVFDYRQAIYSFRGGNTEYCMNFDKEYKNAKVINLDVNYRSKKNIVDKANGFIKRYYGDYEHYSDSIANDHSHGKINVNTYYKRDEEGKDVVDKIESMIKNGEKPDEIAVLY
jgi:DNA helicase-2/ATP-dependent DNA helicase PcrA